LKSRPSRPPAKSKTAEPDPPEIQNAATSLVPGQAFIAQWRDDRGDPVTAFVIRETRERIKALGASPRVKFRFLTAQAERALPFLALVRTNNREDMTYEFWVDSQGEGGSSILAELVEQNQVAISLYSETKRQRRIPVYANRKLSAAARKHLDLSAGRAGWTDEDFNRARDSLCERFPTASALWDFIQAKAGTET